MDIKSLSSALIAGAAAGLIAALLQLWLVQPVLLHAELYESGERTHFAAPSADHHHDPTVAAADSGSDAASDAAIGAAQGTAPHVHATETTGPDAALTSQLDLKRDGLSVLFSILIYTGYALVSLAVLLIALGRGKHFTVRDGLLWGMAGFLAVQFLPAIGLSPELPGMSAADLTQRQIWWGGTVIASGAGLWLIAFGRDWRAWGLAIALIAAPHLIGAPAAHVFEGPAPPELASEFASRALGVGLIGWVVLGLTLFALMFPKRVARA